MNGPRPISAADAINPALQHTKQQLLQPFRWGQWVRLALVGVLAGEMGSGFHLNSSHHHGSGHFLHGALLSHLAHHPAMSAGLIAFVAVLGVGLLALFIYISSVMRFILFDSIVAKECHIRQGWVRRSSEGLRLFVWQIFLLLGTLAAFGMLIGIPVAGAWSAGWFGHPHEHVLGLVLSGVGLLLVLLALVAVLAVVHVMTKDFVVPQMALENLSALEGWRRLWSWLKAEKSGYAGYIGMKIVLAIGVGIVLGILSLMVLLMLLVPIGSVGIGAVLLGKVAGWTWSLQTIALAVALGCMALGVFVFAISMISVPAMVFFPAYSMYFFAPRYAPLAAVLWPQAAAVAPASAPGEPPLSPA